MRHTQNTAKIAQASEAEYAYPIPYYAGLLLPMALAISYIYIFVWIIDDTARYANSMRFACAVREYGPTAY